MPCKAIMVIFIALASRSRGSLLQTQSESTGERATMTAILVSLLVLFSVAMAQQQCNSDDLWFHITSVGSSSLPQSAPCLLRGRPVVERDDYTYTPGVGAHKCHTRKAKWNAARKICEEEGGHLAIINSVAEANAVADVFVESGYPGNWVLIGMHDLFEEGEFVTVHGQSIAEAGYTGWALNEPDRGTAENCGAISKIGEIVDIECYVEFGFICELPVNY